MRALLVEDDKVAQECALTCLYKLGFEEVDLATSMAAGLRHARERRYDLAVVDLGLDEDPYGYRPGLDLISKLREEDKRFPILIWSGRRDWHVRLKGKEAGANAYLVKSADYTELVAQLGRLLDN